MCKVQQSLGPKMGLRAPKIGKETQKFAKMAIIDFRSDRRNESDQSSVPSFFLPQFPWANAKQWAQLAHPFHINERMARMIISFLLGNPNKNLKVKENCKVGIFQFLEEAIFENSF